MAGTALHCVAASDGAATISIGMRPPAIVTADSVSPSIRSVSGLRNTE